MAGIFKKKSTEDVSSSTAKATEESLRPSSGKKRKKRAGGKERRNIWLLVFTTVLVVASVVMFTPPSEKINQGLDIQGGLSVVLSAQSTDGEEVTAEDMEKSRAIIESRVNEIGRASCRERV